MSHVNDMHTWMTAEDFDEAERVLHRRGGTASHRFEVKRIRQRKGEKRAADKREHERVQLSLFGLVVALALAMLACTPAQRLTTLRATEAALELTCAGARIADDEEIAAIIAEAACWARDYTRRRVAALERRLDAAAAKLERQRRAAGEVYIEAIEACSGEPTDERLSKLREARAQCEKLEGWAR